MYLITNEGLKVLEETGLKKICNESFEKLEHYLLTGHIYDDQIEEYAEEHGISDLLEKVEAEESWDKNEAFIMHSGIICSLLQDKLPKSLNNELKKAISAYWIYNNRFLKPFNKSYLWRSNASLNQIESDVHGDMLIRQYDITTEPNLFGDKPLVKKSELNLVNGFYPEWLRTLTDFIAFCCQIRKPVPFKDNWEEVFYNGKLEESNPGEVAKIYINDLKNAKQQEEYSFILVLPFVDNPLKQTNPEKGIYHINPVRSDGGYLSYPFIDGDNLVYLHEAERGTEFLNKTWGKPGVRFPYEQIGEAIKGIVTCIQKGGSRCLPPDPGLVFRHFPYERFQSLSSS